MTGKWCNDSFSCPWSVASGLSPGFEDENDQEQEQDQENRNIHIFTPWEASTRQASMFARVWWAFKASSEPSGDVR
jgi:hypothetical protein